jgi:hypothetical protein
MSTTVQLGRRSWLPFVAAWDSLARPLEMHKAPTKRGLWYLLRVCRGYQRLEADGLPTRLAFACIQL